MPEWCRGCAWLWKNGRTCEIFKNIQDPWLTEDGKCEAYATPEQRAYIESQLLGYKKGIAGILQGYKER